MFAYKKLWNHFLENEAEEFEQVRKLTVKEIKRIGIRKFVRANGWEKKEDVAKWRTDIYDVIPCPHCKKDFGVLDFTLGLCDKCRPKYDFSKFYNDMNNLCGDNYEKSGKLIAFFISLPSLREQYLKNK